MTEPKESASLIEWALYWAEQGVPVFPCGDSKAPLTKNGFYDAVVEPSKVKELFAFYGKSATMIGGRMGAEAGLFAVDVDLYKGSEVKKWFTKAVDDGTLPETRTHKTKSGGLHLLYSSDEYFPNVNPAPGVEVKGEGGYIIMPGTPGYVTIQAGLAEAPTRLIDKLRAGDNKRADTSMSTLEANVLSGADFHQSLTQIAAKMSFNGASQLEVQRHLRALLAESTAASPGHERHSRWRSIMEDRGGELSRIVSTGHTKFNDEASMEAYEDLADYDTLMDAAEQVFGSLKQPTMIEPNKVWPDVEVGPDDPWAFDGLGYFAHEEHEIDNLTFAMYPIFAAGETVMLYAEPKVGKTAIVVNAGLHIACGLHYGDLIVKEAGPVIYYALEGTRAIRLRVAAWKKMKKEDGVELPEVIPFFTVERPTNFLRPETREDAARRLIKANMQSKARFGSALKVIVIDTLTKAMPGGKQNDVDDTSAMFEIISLVRAGGVDATIVFVHHKGKDGGVRGSSNLEAEPDVLLDVSKKNDLVALRIARARSIEDGMKYHFKLEGVDLGKTQQGHPIAGVVARAVQAPAGEDVEEVIREHEESEVLGLYRSSIVGMRKREVTTTEFMATLVSNKALPKGAKPNVEAAWFQKLCHDVAAEAGVIFNADTIIALKKSGPTVVGFTVRSAS